MATKSRKRKRKYTKRKNPSASYRAARRGRRHRPVAYSVGRGKRRRLYRSPQARLLPRRINRKYKRRKNPLALPRQLRTAFGRNRLMRGVSLVVGLGAGAAGKAFVANMLNNQLFNRFGGLLAVVGGAMLNTRARREEIRNIGTGIVAFGIYDLVVMNVPALQSFLPTITGPSAFLGATSYGRSMYGAQLPRNGNAEVVGANISTEVAPEVVGDEMDLADMLEMSA